MKNADVCKNGTKKVNGKCMNDSNATYVELRGEFSFSINQSGFSYRKKTEREQAIKDFWDEFDKFQNSVNEIQQGGYLTLDYDAENLTVEEGE